MGNEPPSNRQEAEPERTNRSRDRGIYEIKIRGCLDSSWSTWFDGLLLTADCERNVTVISGEVPDQAALHGLLIKVRDLGLPLIGVRREEPGRSSA